MYRREEVPVIQKKLVDEKYPPASTFLDLDQIGHSPRDLLEDFKQLGVPLKSNTMIKLD